LELHEKALLTTLPNGLELILLPMPYAPVATVMICYRAGSVMEGAGTRGLSHFVEHMMFKGTPAVPGSRFWGMIQSFGGVANAFTSRDLTAYYEVLPASGTECALELESDRMSSLVFEEAEVERERTVILEERRTSSVESAAGAIDEALFLRAMPSHPYGQPITGSDSDISAFDSACASEFYSRFYNPANAVVTVAGRIDPDRVRASVERHFGPLRPGLRSAYPAAVDPWGPPGRERVTHPSELPRLSLAFPAPPSDHEDWPLLEMAATWLSGTRSSRLDEILVHGGLALGVSAGGFFSACPGIFSVRASLCPDTDPTRAEALVMQELEALRSSPWAGRISRTSRHSRRSSHSSSTAIRWVPRRISPYRSR
jgi:zinc protease